jgi:choline-sulfatase
MKAWLLAAFSRVLAGACGGVTGGVVAAIVDAWRTAQLSGQSFGATFPVSVGLLLPLALVLGVGLGVTLAVVFPESSRAALARWFTPELPLERGERGLLLLLSPPAFGLWLLWVAGTALRGLASESEGPLSAGVALGTTVFGLALAAGVFAAARVLAGRAPSFLSPARALLGSLSISFALLTLIVVTGEPSGSGGPLSLFGVLTRDELDLRPVSMLIVIAAGAVGWPLARTRIGIALTLGLSLVPPALLLPAAESRLDEPELSLAVERSSPFAGKLLKQLRKRSDADRDGYSARYGGGDCDDHDPQRNPAADDVPGNGLDEDCSGSDARARSGAKPPQPSATASAAARASLPEGLNVVLITIDTLRYDLGYLGATRPISPRLDELSRESVLFERAYSLASYTAKSLPPMLIGRYCSETHRGYSHFNRFEKTDTFLAERLQKAGIQSVSVQGHWYFFQNYGMERGFTRIDSSAQPKQVQAEGDRTSTSEKLTDAALAELARPELAQKPFFFWTHYTDPHAEYAEHPGFDFGKDARARYDGEIAYVDHHVGRLLDGLRKSPLWAKTVVIVTSDHGEAFGEHGMIRHGFELWEELVRVPLLVRVPGVAARRITTRRSAIDLVPTVLELFRLPLPEGADALSGQSLVADLLAPGEPPPRPILVDMPEGPHNAERSAFIDADVKLITSGGRPLGLYDLAADPAEKTNLMSDKERTKAALESFKEFRRGLREVRVRAP